MNKPEPGFSPQAEEAQIPKAVQRIALCVEYDGSVFNGWQAQLNPRINTVQETLEKALSNIAAHPIRVICAGRTDSGVHASGQIVHFESPNIRPLKAWSMGVNSQIGDHVSVRWACVVPEDFHARFSALRRRYIYCICNESMRPALLNSFLTHHHYPLDAQLMHEAGQHLLGTNDFSSFRGAGCQANTPVRNVHSLSVIRRGRYVLIDIEANAFLLHMVRNIAGTLMVIGRGKRPVDWTAELLALKDRTQAAVTAPAAGLCLYQVTYPEHFQLPASPEYFLSELTRA